MPTKNLAAKKTVRNLAAKKVEKTQLTKTLNNLFCSR